MKCSMFGQSPPEITYLGSGTGPFNIGPARSDRLLVAFLGYESDAATQVGAVTIGGVSATFEYNPIVSDPFGIARAIVPTGTTASLTTSGAFALAVYMITGLANVAKYSDNATSSPGTNCVQSITTPEGFSAVLCGARSRNGNAPFTCTGTGPAVNMQANSTYNLGGGSNPGYVFGSTVANGAGSPTITQVGSFSSGLGYSVCYH